MVSARMGAGHDGAAAELCRRLEARGHQALKVDFLDAAPRLGRALQRTYQAQLAAAPWSYEALYRLWFLLPWLARPTAFVLAKLFGRRLRRWARAWNADVVVSTYPLASVALGRERRRLGVPLATFLTDFAVHPLWVHPGVDLHLCVHPASAARAARASGRPAIAPGPLVGDRFFARPARRHRARAGLGIPPDARVALVVAGSWGVGEVEQTVADLCAAGPWLPLVVCGRNPGLQRRLAAQGRGLVLGWTDQMPELMAAADVLVQNGGGLTCMEAFAAGLPVVSYRPIPGHGRQNALDMEAAGVAAYARTPEELGPALERAITLAGRRMVALGRALFSSDPATHLCRLAGAAGEPARLARPRIRRLAVGAAALVCAYAGMNLAAEAATASGLGVARPAPNSRATYVAVRLGPATLADPRLPGMLAADHTTAIVEGRLALAQPQAVRHLAQQGVSVASGGWGSDSRFHIFSPGSGVLRADQVISAQTHRPCRYFAPDQAVNSFDLAAARLGHQTLVRASANLRPGRPPLGLQPRHIYVVDAESASAISLERTLERLHELLSRQGLTNAPLTQLR